jgi:hypothetical protein
MSQVPVAVEEKLTSSSCGFYSDMVVHRALKALFASKVFSVVCTETWPSKN